MAVSGLSARSAVVKAPVVSLPEELKALWQAAGWVLDDSALVDGRHLVCVFFVDHGSRAIGAGIPQELTKYTDSEGHAPFRAKYLKLATLRHYREHHKDLEGTWDPMEGRTTVVSSLGELLGRHGAMRLPHGAHHVKAKTTYGTDDTTFIYCTSRSMDRVSGYEQWRVASCIRDVPRFALLLGAEFGRQRDGTRHAPVTGLDWLAVAASQSSGLDSVVRVYHGPVVYDDEAGEVLFGRIPGLARGIASHFFKRTRFKDQQEYRFVVAATGGRAIDQEFFLRISPNLRSVVQRL